VPNAGHVALATLENLVADLTLATQNVDSLHLRAGSRNVVELHGSLRETRCTRCGVRQPLGKEGLALDAIEHDCGGRLRPDIVWFGEALPPAAWTRAREAASRAGVIIVIGTSAVVYPAAALATHYNPRAFVAEINPEATAISDRVDCAVREGAAQALPRVVSLLEAARREAR
jgi:NAD-dependent deacetylase